MPLGVFLEAGDVLLGLLGFAEIRVEAIQELIPLLVGLL